MRSMIGFAIAVACLFATAAQAGDVVRIKTAREILASYSSITNISDSNPEIREIYNGAADRLPRYGSPDELSNTVILAATELGGAFCKAALVREKDLKPGQRRLFGDVNFKRGPSQFVDVVRQDLMKSLSNSFWQRDATTAEQQSLSKTMNATLADSKDAPEDTITVVQILCATYATSLAFFVK